MSNEKRKAEARASTAKDIPESFLKLLLHTKAADFALADGEPIFYAHRTDKVAATMKAMQGRKVMSVPIILKKEQNWRYFGVVDMYDIVKYTVNHFGSKGAASKARGDKFEEDSARANSVSMDWSKVMETEEFQNTTLNDIIAWPLSKSNPFHPVREDYSAWSVLEPMAREGLHRIPVVSRNGQIVNFVTQSQVIRLLHANIESLGKRLQLPVESCRRFYKPVVTVTLDTIVLDAFNTLVEQNITGLAVVDKQGMLTGSLSLRDIKAIYPDGSKFDRLHMTVEKYLQCVNDEFGVADQRPRTTISATSADSISSVIRSLVNYKIHRVFITRDAKDKIPIGVVTAQDLIMDLVDVDEDVEPAKKSYKAAVTAATSTAAAAPVS